MAIADILKKFGLKKQKFQEAQQEDRIQNIVQERKKSSNERELDRFFEEERERKIKVDLESFREKRKEEMRETTVLNGKNIFKGHNSILDQPNIFANQPNIFAGQRGMFFK